MDVIHRSHCKSQIRPTVFYGGCSLQIRRLIHLDDALLWENNGNCPGTMTCSIIVLMASRPSTAWWRYQMEKFSALLVFCAGNLPVTGEFPAQRPVGGVLMFSLICAWTNNWTNSGDAGDLTLHRAHYDVIVMRVVLEYPSPPTPTFSQECILQSRKCFLSYAL